MTRSAVGSTSAGVRPAVLPSVLCVVGDDDDPAFRAALSTAIGGGAVDYFDARAATPTLGQLTPYTAVYTWVNGALLDRNVTGDHLADYVDAGGKVILGPFCTFTTGFSMGGRIMTAPYSPVTSPGGSNHFSNSSYVGDGTRSAHAGVLAYDMFFRDALVLQGAGIANGHYADGEIAQAYRPDGRVIYSNGTAWSTIAGTGDWIKITANLVLANPSSPGLLYAPSDADDPTLRSGVSAFTTGVVDYFNTNVAVPSAALLATYDAVYTWPNFAFFDNNLWGDRLADRVDAGGRVILGTFCTYVSLLGGRIMTPDYSPVASPTATNHYTVSTYSGDGITALYGGVAALTTGFRDFLIGQGNGIVDGHYADGEILGAYRPDGRVFYVNAIVNPGYGSTGDGLREIANAVTGTFPTGRKLLYAPADVDDPTMRARIAAQTGGIVDYWDARAATPTLPQLLSYDGVYTFTNFQYLDQLAFGNVLASYADAGGKVLLGAFTTFRAFGPGYGLTGQIMTPAYCPVASPGGGNHYFNGTYANDAYSSIHRNILTYASDYRDSLVLQGSGVLDGHFADGEIAEAYRPDRKVIYLNGAGNSLFSTGDTPRLIANALEAGFTTAVLYGSNDAGQMFIVNTKTGAGNIAATTPTFGGIGAGEIECMGASGVAWVQGTGVNDKGQRFFIGTGAPVAGAVADAATFDGLEYALGRLYGAWMPGPCAPSTFGTLDPVTGASTSLGPSGVGQLSGLAFDPRGSVMYGISGICSGAASLYRVEITGGAVTSLGPLGTTIGSLEFGPDGDLYGSGDSFDGGNLYRVSTRNGLAQLVGNPGFGGISGLTLAPPGTVDAHAPVSNTLSLASPYPNPGRGMVRFSFSLPTAGSAEAQLFDVAGRMVWHTTMPNLGPGTHGFTWSGLASGGARLGSGMYLMRLVTPSGERSVRVVRLD